MIVSWLFAMALASFGQAPPLRPALLDPKTVEAISTDEFRQLSAATCCAPCVKDVPELMKLEEKYKERGFKLLAVWLDEPKELEANVRPFVAKRFPGFVTYLCKEPDHDKFASVIDTVWNEIMPTDFLLDRLGRLRATLTGGKSLAEFEAAIAPLLK
jgi:thiol-disulfide isomerase/thioredoxin